MAGIYIHIPFCKQPCSYCNFYFSTSLYFKEQFLTALNKEIHLQSKFLDYEIVATIYFGGGTPSLLSAVEIEHILNSIYKNFKVEKDVEITLEANPDDLTSSKLTNFKKAGINRLSIGTQSFFNDDLKLMNRAHNSDEALQSIQKAQDIGFHNISIDLIYGIPSMSKEKWLENLTIAFSQNIQHLSCYALTVEENTPLFHQIRKQKIEAPSDIEASAHFDILMDFTRDKNWVHYEISNFCKEGYISKHNTSYWQQKKYLGLGPAAHSFDGKNRQWNIANNKKYVESLKNDIIPFEVETLSEKDQFNEAVMIGLRTMWGVNLNQIATKFPGFYAPLLMQLENIDKSLITLKKNHLKLTQKGKHFADRIAADLFV